MSTINNPFSLYTDATGKPLDGAYIYIGQAGQNPETAPVSVYWDEAKTIPAAQPLRTVSGFINRNGSAANVHLAGAYSITVKDKNGVVVFSDLNRVTNPDGYLANLTFGSIVAGLGFMPVNAGANASSMLGKAYVFSEYTDFNANDANTLEVQGAAGGHAALIQFVRPGNYGLKCGLNSIDQFGIGGYSQGANVYRVMWDTAGNQTTLGNVTAYSDERFKEEVERIEDAVARTLQMEGIRYLDNRTGARKIGAIAQAALKAGFGEAVNTDADGNLSLAYGQLALALVIENTRELHDEIVSLRAELQQLKGQ